MATYLAKRFSGPQYLSTTVANQYQVASGKTAVVKEFIFNNTSGSAATVSVHVVPNGGVVAASNQIITTLQISGASQIVWSADIPLEAGEAIAALSGTASAITMTVSGIEVTA